MHREKNGKNESISTKRRVVSAAENICMYIAVGITALLLIGLLCYIFYRGLPHISWELLSKEPSVIRGITGILPNILNTLYIVLFTLIIVGSVTITSVSAPAIRLVPSEQNWTKNSIPTRPYIIDGMPERVSVANSIIFTSFLFFAYSLR